MSKFEFGSKIYLLNPGCNGSSPPGFKVSESLLKPNPFATMASWGSRGYETPCVDQQLRTGFVGDILLIGQGGVEKHGLNKLPSHSVIVGYPLSNSQLH